MKFKLSVALILLFSFSIAHADFDPNNPFADECGESSTAALPFVLAANSADQVLCLNALTGKVESDKQVAMDCFLGKRIQALAKNPNYSQKASCNQRFVKLCAEISNCQEEDQIFGGTKLFCGHLGGYLDLFWRIRRGLPASFEYSDGVKLCEELAKSSGL